MTGELCLILIVSLIVITAGIAFVLSIFSDRIEKERLLLQKADFKDFAGFSVSDYPKEDFLRLDRIYLLGRKIAQMEFFVQPGWTAVLRVAIKENDLKLWELGTIDYDQLTVRKVDGIRTELRQEQNGAAMIRWERDGFTYALYLPHTEMGLAGSLMERFVTVCRCTSYK